MREEYYFNDNGVCTNPDCFTFKCDQGSFSINTAFLSGQWINGYTIQLKDRGASSPVSENGEKFSSEQNATNDACMKIRKYLKKVEYNVRKLEKEAEGMINRQLELF